MLTLPPEIMIVASFHTSFKCPHLGLGPGSARRRNFGGRQANRNGCPASDGHERRKAVPELSSGLEPSQMVGSESQPDFAGLVLACDRCWPII